MNKDISFVLNNLFNCMFFVSDVNNDDQIESSRIKREGVPENRGKCSYNPHSYFCKNNLRLNDFLNAKLQQAILS